MEKVFNIGRSSTRIEKLLKRQKAEGIEICFGDVL